MRGAGLHGRHRYRDFRDRLLGLGRFHRHGRIASRGLRQWDQDWGNHTTQLLLRLQALDHFIRLGLGMSLPLGFGHPGSLGFQHLQVTLQVTPVDLVVGL
ncbi:hypothetical protein D3C78_1244170 [compost metagenome]